jgi:hypothetical protein
MTTTQNQVLDHGVGRPAAAARPLVAVVAVSVGLAMALLVFLHVPGMDGPWYWKWAWRSLPLLPYGPLMILSAAPVLLGLALREFRPRTPTGVVLGLFMAGVMCMKLTSAAVLTRPMSLDAVGAIVLHPDTTSYYTDAGGIARVYPSGYAWLGNYSEILRIPQLNLHTRSKPAGPVTFFVTMIRLGGYGRHTAILSGVILGALATLSVPATWWFARVMLGGEPHDDAAIRAAALLALCPGFVLLFPVFDPIYVAFAAVMLGTWHRAVSRDRLAWSAATGVALMATTFVSYTPLVLGAFMCADALLIAPSPAPFRARVMRLLRHGVTALIVCAAAYAVLWLFTGYDPIATFRQAAANQHALLTQHARDRPYPFTALFDLTDFALGAGWIIPLITIGGTIRATAERDLPRVRLMLTCLTLPLLVALTGLLQSETARVWNFMLPLLTLPAAIETGRWSRAARAAAYLALLAVLLVVGQNLTFL